MKELKLLAKLAQAYKALTNEEVALLLRPFTWTVLARGTHPEGDTATTAHTAAVNIMQHAAVANMKCLTTYAPTLMCTGMARNLSLEFISLRDNLDEGDEVGGDSLPDPVAKGRQFLNAARKLTGAGKAVVDAFDDAVPYTRRRAFSTTLAAGLATLPKEVPFRWAPQATDLKNCYMGLACSLVALTWSERNMHARDLSRAEKLCGNNVGAVITKNNQVIAWGLNHGAEHLTLHAETTAIQAYLARTGEATMPSNCVVYTSLQPCHMCAGFIAQCCPNATVIYALKDGGLRTCLESVERQWDHHVAVELAEAIRTARASEEQQYSTIHYLKGDTLRDRFLAALPLLEADISSDERLQDLQAHCMEVLRNIASAGMATGSGIDVLIAAIGAEAAVEESLEERRLHQIAEKAQDYREKAKAHHTKAATYLSTATAEFKKAQKSGETIAAQIPILSKILGDAEAARNNASGQTSSKLALPFVQNAEKCVQTAQKPEADACIAHDKVIVALEIANAALIDALRIVEKGEDAVSVANEARNRLPETRQGGPLTSLQNQLETLTQQVSELKVVIRAFEEANEKVMKDIQQVVEKIAAAAASARLARVRLGKLGAINPQKTNAEKIASEIKDELLLALQNELDLEIEHHAELQDQTEQYGSEKAQRLALAALEEAQEKVDKARERLATAREFATNIKMTLEEMQMAVTSMHEATSESDIDSFGGQVTQKAKQVTEKKSLFDEETRQFHSSLFSAHNQIEQARDPIKCSSCQRILTSDTTDKTRWHQCSSCGIYFCNTCGYNRTRVQFFSQERICTCKGTTTLI